MNIDYTRYYLKWHDDSDAHRASMIAYYRNLLESLLPADKSAQVLDVGCGMGFALLALREMGFSSLSGVESDPGQAKSCQAKNLNVSLRDDTIEFLKQQPKTQDLIVCLDVIEHIPVGVQLAFVRALAGALRPGGKLICTVPNANSALAARWRYNDWTHAASFTEHSLDFLLYNGGFTDIQVAGHEFNRRPKQVWLPVGGTRHWWAFRFFRLFRRLEMMAELGPAQGRAVPLSLNLIATANKRSD
ncbi:MAG: class I SAM-dependent methyltransferase [Verrucomicrobia subdivision 3 bacterium]|nr:class I SAM-dependent methyltransferase [Limisphaerales bacterium]